MDGEGEFGVNPWEDEHLPLLPPLNQFISFNSTEPHNVGAEHVGQTVQAIK